MDATLVALLVAIAGTLTSAVLGWLDSGDKFDPRKFATSVVHAIVAGVVIVVELPSLGSVAPLIANAGLFLQAAGIDVILNRAEGTIAARRAPTQPNG